MARRCLSRTSSSRHGRGTYEQIEDKPCEWHEKFLLVIENDADHIVLNVMSTAALTGDSFVGQTVINLGHYPMLSSCNTVVRTNVGIHGRLEYPIFDTCGKAIHKEHIVGSYEGGGVLRLGLSSGVSDGGVSTAPPLPTPATAAGASLLPIDMYIVVTSAGRWRAVPGRQTAWAA